MANLVDGKEWISEFDDKAWNERRKFIASQYHKNLNAVSVKKPSTPEYATNAYHIYPILIENRDHVLTMLQELEIQTIVHYPTPLHLQPALGHLGYKRGDFPNAEWACAHELSLPIFPQLRDDEVDRVIQAVNQVIV